MKGEILRARNEMQRKLGLPILGQQQPLPHVMAACIRIGVNPARELCLDWDCPDAMALEMLEKGYVILKRELEQRIAAVRGPGEESDDDEEVTG